MAGHEFVHCATSNAALANKARQRRLRLTRVGSKWRFGRSFTMRDFHRVWYPTFKDILWNTRRGTPRPLLFATVLRTRCLHRIASHALLDRVDLTRIFHDIC